MSTEESVDPRLVEQAQQQIRGLVDEIVALSRRELPPEQFYAEYLSRVVSALAAVGGVVWKAGQGGGPEVLAQMNFREDRVGDGQQDLVRHRRLIHRAFQSGEPGLILPRSGGAEDQGANPTEYLLVLSPVKVADETHNIVEIFQRPNPSIKTQRGYLRFLSQMCELASQFLKNRQLQHYTDRQSLWSQLEQFTKSAHTSLVPRDVAYTIANEGRRLVQCDRVSVAVRSGRGCKIQAISGQDTFDARSNVVTLLNELATAVVRAGEPVWYTGDTSNMPPQIEQAVQAYVDESHTKHLAVIPLARAAKVSAEGETTTSRPVGALIIEQIEDTTPREGYMQRVNVVSEHSAAALANALEYHELFLMPVWRAIGQSRVLVEARNLPKTIAAGAVALVVMLGLIFVPYDFNLHSGGTLQPITRYDVFAGIDGVVEEVRVRHDQEVAADTLLVKLGSRQKEIDLEGRRGDLGQTEKERDAVERLAFDRRLPPEEREKYQAQLPGLNQKIISLQQQIAILELEIEQARVLSPIAGRITTWNVEEVLRARPVMKGQRLLSVADTTGDWEVELKMPEDRMGHLAEAQGKLGRELDVTFHLATDPAVRYQGKIREVHLSAEVRGEEGNTVLIKVSIDKTALPQPLRPGADIAAKVHCGQKALGYVIFSDLVAWFRRNVLFKMF